MIESRPTFPISKWRKNYLIALIRSRFVNFALENLKNWILCFRPHKQWTISLFHAESELIEFGSIPFGKREPVGVRMLYLQNISRSTKTVVAKLIFYTNRLDVRTHKLRKSTSYKDEYSSGTVVMVNLHSATPPLIIITFNGYTPMKIGPLACWIRTEGLNKISHRENRNADVLIQIVSIHNNPYRIRVIEIDN